LSWLAPVDTLSRPPGMPTFYNPGNSPPKIKEIRFPHRKSLPS
jgi:hypothetical protein